MENRKVVFAIICGWLLSAPLQAEQQATQEVQTRTEAQTGGAGPGSRMMTEQERMEQRNRMREAQTNEERGRIRSENHERMRERAARQGYSMPNYTPASGMGMGRGMGGGGGKGR